MAGNRYIANNAGTLTEVVAIQSSAGAGDAGKIAALDATGKFDQSMMPMVTGRATADQRVANNVLVNLTNLAVPITAAQVLAIDAFIVYDSTLTNKIQVAITVPSGAVLLWGAYGPATSALTTNATPNFLARTAVAGSNVGSYGGTRAAGASRVLTTLMIRGTVVNASTAGNVQIQGAKQVNTDTTSPADDAQFYANNWLRAVPIS